MSNPFAPLGADEVLPRYDEVRSQLERLLKGCFDAALQLADLKYGQPLHDLVRWLDQALLLACKRVADGPQEYHEAKTAECWFNEFLEQAQHELIAAGKAAPPDQD